MGQAGRDKMVRADQGFARRRNSVAQETLSLPTSTIFINAVIDPGHSTA